MNSQQDTTPAYPLVHVSHNPDAELHSDEPYQHQNNEAWVEAEETPQQTSKADTAYKARSHWLKLKDTKRGKWNRLFLTSASKWLPTKLKHFSSKLVYFEEEEKFRRRFAAEMAGRRRRALKASPRVLSETIYGPIALPEPLIPWSYIGRPDDVPRKDDDGQWAARVAASYRFSAFIYRSMLRTINDPRIPASLLQISAERQPTLMAAVQAIRLEGHNNDQMEDVDLGMVPTNLLGLYYALIEEVETLDPFTTFQYVVGNGPVWTALPPPGTYTVETTTITTLTEVISVVASS